MTDRFTPKPGTVYFIGAGPGAPDLITVRAKEIIAQADLILYADSLVEESIAALGRKLEVKIVPSSGLHLEQILQLILETAQAGGIVARVHSGDPALYGAIHEQMAYLEDYQIPYEVVPGVTAAFAVAAHFKTELTVPDVVQTVILTRTAGRTTMPEGERLLTLAAPGASLAIYLSISRIRQVVADLLAGGGYSPETPVVVAHKATWPDESYVSGTLADIVEKVKAAGYTKHALILVSPALQPALKAQEARTSSHLYDKSYTHRFRRAENFQRGKERHEAGGGVAGVIMGEKHLGQTPARQGAVVIAVTRQGSQLAGQLAGQLAAEAVIPAKFAPLIDSSFSSVYTDSALTEVRRRWSRHEQLILVMPSGIAVRAIAPLVGHKATDPAVLCLDEAGHFVIPLLGGHQAGANSLAQEIAALTGGQAVVTTASDIQGKPALDLPPFTERALGGPWQIEPKSALTHASASLVNDEPIGLYLDPALAALREPALAWLQPVENLTLLESLDELDLDAYAAGLVISHRQLDDHHQHLLRKSVLYRPRLLVAGLGCKRAVPVGELQGALTEVLLEARLAPESLAALATADLKANEPGLQALAQALNLPLEIVDRTRLATLSPANFSPSAAQEKFNLPGVAEPCALLAAGPQGQLLVPKQTFERCTVAIALAGGSNGA
jgi:precorrin-4 C11-methyltransferase